LILGLLRNTFLPTSETFIYEQLRHYQSIEVEIIARERINSDHFINSWSINELAAGNGSKIKNKWQRLLYTTGLTSKKKISKIIQERNIHILHAHFGVDATYAVDACRSMKIPLVVTVHGYDITRLPRFKIFPLSWLHYYFKFKTLVKNATLFLAVSNHIKQKLIAQGVPEHKIQVHHIGVDIDKFHYRQDPDSEIIDIVTVGRLTEKKGTKYLLDAFNRVFSEQRNIRLIIIGDGPLKNELIEYARKLECFNNVVFEGQLSHDEVQGKLQSAHIFVLPSVTAQDGDQEGLGMVILEASATGLPIIATRSGGIVDAVFDGESGYLVDERDVRQLSERLKRLANNRAERIEMGYKGRGFIEEHFDIRKQTKKLEELYKKHLQQVDVRRKDNID